MLLLNIISELLRDQTLVGQPKELPCRLKIKVIYFGGFCYLMNGTFMSFSRYEFEAKLSDRCLRWFRLHTNLYKFGKLFLQLFEKIRFLINFRLRKIRKSGCHFENC